MSDLFQKRAWLIWLLAASFFFAEYFARVAPSVMVPQLMHSLHVTAFSLGSLSAFFYYAYVAMQIPVGILVDRFGAHRLLTTTALLCGISCIIFANATSLGAAEASRFLMGFSAAFAFVGALKIANVWFPGARFGLLAGLTQAVGMLGAATGEGPLAVLVAHIGWRHTMYAIGFTLLGIAALIGLIVRDKPKKITLQRSTNTPPHSLLSNLWVVLKNPQTWVNGLFVGFLYAPTAAFAELWGTSYIHHVYHLSTEISATAIGMIFIGWLIGSPLAGWLSDKTQRRKPVMLFSVLFSFIFMSLVLYMPHLSELSLLILLFCYGLSNVGVALSYAVACDINPKAAAGTSMSFANMASVIIGALFQPILGWLLDLHWHHTMVNGTPFYSAQDYRVAMLVIPACFIVSFAAWCFLKESHPAQQLKPNT